jgi:hypothetical protein
MLIAALTRLADASVRSDVQFLQDAAAVLDRSARVRADAHIKALPPPPRAVGTKSDRQHEPQEAPPPHVQGGLPRHLRDLLQAAEERGVSLLLLPQGMSLRRANKSHFNRKASHIVWSVRVRFGQEAPVVSMFPDSATILHIVTSMLRPSQVAAAAECRTHQQPADNGVLPAQRQQQRVKRLPGSTAYALAGWAALPQEDLGVFLKLQSPAAVPLYKRLELCDTLQQVPPHAGAAIIFASHALLQALRGCMLVEQPEVFVVQRSAWASMNTSAAAAAAAVEAAAVAVRRVAKKRRTARFAGDGVACEQLLLGHGEVAAALKVYSPSDEQDVELSESCSSDSDDDDDDVSNEDDAGDHGDCDDGLDGGNHSSCIDHSSNVAAGGSM